MHKGRGRGRVLESLGSLHGLAAVNSLLLAWINGAEMQRAAAADVMPVKRRHDTIDRREPQIAEALASTNRPLAILCSSVCVQRVFNIHGATIGVCANVWCCVIVRADSRKLHSSVLPHTQTSKLPQRCKYPEKAPVHVRRLEKAFLELHVLLQCLFPRADVRTLQL